MWKPTHARSVFRLGTLILLSGTAAGVCSTEPGTAPTSALDLTISGVGQGTLAIDPQAKDTVGASFYFAQGATVTVSAMPTSGSVFTGWGKATGTDAAPAGCTQPANPCTVTLNERKSVVGHFTVTVDVRRWDGDYTGTMVKSGNAGTGPLELRIDAGTVQGWLTPSGTLGTFTGTVNDAGAFSATIQGVGGACPVALSGQFTTSTAAGITGALASGTFTLQGQSCNGQSGTWSVSRDQVPVTKTVAPQS